MDWLALPDERITVDHDSTQDRADTPIVESASATTDPDNQNSGPGAYIIFGVVVALLALLILSFSSCTSILSQQASLLSSTGYGTGWDTRWDQDWDMDWDDQLDGIVDEVLSDPMEWHS